MMHISLCICAVMCTYKYLLCEWHRSFDIGHVCVSVGVCRMFVCYNMMYRNTYMVFFFKLLLVKSLQLTVVLFVCAIETDREIT